MKKESNITETKVAEVAEEPISNYFEKTNPILYILLNTDIELQEQVETISCLKGSFP